MAKTVLNIEYDFDFWLVGISSYLRDYRISWSLNKTLDIELKKENDYEITHKKPDNSQFFSHYSYICEQTKRIYHLFANKCPTGLLLPEVKHADYLLMLEGNFNDQNIEELCKLVRETENINTVFNIDVETLKSKKNLIF
ncbi:MAG: IPExxxVDY family protein [Bacteroidia bacterium]